MEEPKPSKISRGTIVLMGGVALMYELVNLGLNVIPIAGDPIGTFFLGIIADMHFYVWFKMKGVSFAKKPSRALVFFGSEFLELFPVLDEFAIIAGVAFTIISVRTEEKLEASKTVLEKRNFKPPFPRKISRNVPVSDIPNINNGGGYDSRQKVIQGNFGNGEDGNPEELREAA